MQGIRLVVFNSLFMLLLNVSQAVRPDHLPVMHEASSFMDTMHNISSSAMERSAFLKTVRALVSPDVEKDNDKDATDNDTAVFHVLARDPVYVLVDFFSFAVWNLLWALLAWGTVSRLGILRKPLPRMLSKDFPHNPFSCGEDLQVCLWSCCCPATIIAENNYRADIAGYWTSIGIIFLSLFVPCGMFFPRIYWRSQLKREAGFDPITFCECCAVFWCEPCTITQEALYIKEADKKIREALVGPALGVGAEAGPTVPNAGVVPNGESVPLAESP